MLHQALERNQAAFQTNFYSQHTESSLSVTNGEKSKFSWIKTALEKRKKTMMIKKKIGRTVTLFYC